ncbi:MAG: CHASE domain-containing protein [Verrucomicrobia bacterium]|nr:CHASE domain-containing protein [Verrucomicrobiota bacterium]
MGFFATAWVARLTWENATLLDANRFHSEVTEQWDAFKTAIKLHEAALRSFVEFSEASLECAPSEFSRRWDERIKRSNLPLYYPGFADFGYAPAVGEQGIPRARPDQPASLTTGIPTHSVAFPVTHHWRSAPVPDLTGVNLNLQPNRAAIVNAHSIQGHFITPPLSLTNTLGTHAPIGLRFFAPVYNPDILVWSEAIPRPLSGVVFGTIVVDRLLRPIFERKGGLVHFELTMDTWSGTRAWREAPRYARLDGAGYWDEETNFVGSLPSRADRRWETNFVTVTRRREWTVRAYATERFAVHSRRHQAVWIAVGGTGLSIAFAGLVGTQVRHRNKATALATRLTHSETQIRAMAESKSRISRELHDRTLQSLFATELSLQKGQEQLENRLHPSNATGVSEQISTSLDMLRSVSRDLRQFVLLSDSPEFNPDTFEAELREWLQRVSRATGTRIGLEIESGFARRTTREVQIACGAILSETIGNAIRHGEAGQIEVALKCLATRIELSVEDDGAGFEPAEVRNGNGMKNLMARTKELGGELRIESSEGGPTVVRMSLPG